MTSSATAPRKAALRKQLRQQRRELDESQQALVARRLAQRFLHLPAFQRSNHLALYLAQDGEIDLGPLLKICWRSGKRTYLPVIRSGAELEFSRYRPGDSLQLNRFGIPEPARSRELRDALQIDVIVAPLVAYSRRGSRLGMGGGYYDRSLHRLQKRRGKPLLLGAAHSFQEVEDIPEDHWDVRLHGVITELGYTRCSA